MIKKILQTFKDTIIYSISAFANKFVGFLLLPLYTKLLTPNEYGIWGIIEITITLISTLLLLGQNQAFIRFYHEKEVDFRTLFSSQLTFLFGIATGTSILGELLAPNLAQYFQKPVFFLDIFRVMFIIIGLRVLTLFLFDSLRARGESLVYTTLNLIRFFVLLMSNIVFLLIFDLKIKGILLAALIADMSSLFILLVKTRPFFRWSFDGELLKQGLKFGFPFIIGSMAWMFLNVGDRYILKFLAGYKSVGIYSTGYKFANVINLLFIQPFSMSFIPLAYKYYHQGEYEEYFNNLLKYIVFLIGWGGFVLSIFSPEVIQFVVQNEAYYSAWVVVPYVCFAYIFTAATSVIIIGFNIQKKTRFNALTTILSAILNLILNIYFIPMWGIRGAALATLLSFAFRFMIVKILVHRVFEVSYQYKNLVKVLLTWIILYGGVDLLGSILVLKILSVFLFPILLYWMYFFSKNELDFLQTHFFKRCG